MPEISVIIPAHNSASSLPALLESLQRQTLSGDRFEVIVVENGSHDGTAEVAQSYGARVIRETIANRSLARNRGAEAAESTLFAFTDADCVADPRWLEALLANSELAPLVAGNIRTTVSPNPNLIERFEALWRFGQEAWVQQGWSATANLLVNAAAFQAVGGFDPAWNFGEDVVFCFRARDLGMALRYCKEAIVDHPGEHELIPFLRRLFSHGYAGNKAVEKLGAGYKAWRQPWPALVGDSALRSIGHDPASFDPLEWRRMARMARLGYSARVVGSLWAELKRAR